MIKQRWTAGTVADGAIGFFLLASVFSIAASQTAMSVAILAWWVSLARREGPWPRFPLGWSMTAFLAASLLAAWDAAVDRGLALESVRTFWLPGVFFLVCVNRFRDLRGMTRRVRFLVACGALSACFGLYQSVVHGTSFRVTGTMSHYMTFAGLMMFCGLLGLAALLWPPDGGREWWIAGASALMLSALLMTQTRSAWVGGVAGVTLLVARWRARLLWLLPLLSVLVVVFSPDPVRQRVKSLVDPTNITALERVFMFRSGLRIVADYPLTGVGPGGDNLSRLYPGYKLPDDPWDPRNPFVHLHNSALQIAAERGLIGLAAWLWIWVAWFRLILGIHRRLAPEDRPGLALVAGSVACVVAFLAAGQFEDNFGDSEVLNLLCLIMAIPFAAAVDRSDRPAAEVRR